MELRQWAPRREWTGHAECMWPDWVIYTDVAGENPVSGCGLMLVEVREDGLQAQDEVHFAFPRRGAGLLCCTQELHRDPGVGAALGRHGALGPCTCRVSLLRLRRQRPSRPFDRQGLVSHPRCGCPRFGFLGGECRSGHNAMDVLGAVHEQPCRCIVAWAAPGLPRCRLACMVHSAAGHTLVAALEVRPGDVGHQRAPRNIAGGALCCEIFAPGQPPASRLVLKPCEGQRGHWLTKEDVQLCGET